jgi:hypothetical protein
VTVLELCVSRAGLIKGARLAQYVAAWSIASNALGHPIEADELAAWWGKGMSRRTAFYRLRDFREAFPEFDSPQPLADALAAVARSRKDRKDASKLVMEPVDLDGLAAA